MGGAGPRRGARRPRQLRRDPRPAAARPGRPARRRRPRRRPGAGRGAAQGRRRGLRGGGRPGGGHLPHRRPRRGRGRRSTRSPTGRTELADGGPRRRRRRPRRPGAHARAAGGAPLGRGGRRRRRGALPGARRAGHHGDRRGAGPARRWPGGPPPGVPAADPAGTPRTSRSAGAGSEVQYLLADTDEARVRRLQDRLAALGDSLVVVGVDTPAGREWNVHVHVADVGAAIEAGIEAGRPHRISVTPLAPVRPPAPEPGRRALVALVAAAERRWPRCSSPRGCGSSSFGDAEVPGNELEDRVLAEVLAATAQDVVVLPNGADCTRDRLPGRRPRPRRGPRRRRRAHPLAGAGPGRGRRRRPRPALRRRRHRDGRGRGRDPLGRGHRRRAGRRSPPPGCASPATCWARSRARSS